MALTADEWHILSICLFPAITCLGVSASICISTAHNRTWLAMGVMFSAGVLLSASLVHMLPHAAETLDLYFAAGEGDVHDDHGGEEIHFEGDGHDDHEDELLYDHDEDGHDDHAEETAEEHAAHNATVEDDHHDDALRFLRLLQDAHEDEDDHADHAHAFPWANTIFSIAFIFLLCVEAAMERFIDVYFAGKKGNFFHIHDDDREEIMFAEGLAAAAAEEQKKRQDAAAASAAIVAQQTPQLEGIVPPVLIAPPKSQAGTEAEREELVAPSLRSDDDVVPLEKRESVLLSEGEHVNNGSHGGLPFVEEDDEVILHDYGDCPSNCCDDHGHNHDHADVTDDLIENGTAQHGHNHDHADATDDLIENGTAQHLQQETSKGHGHHRLPTKHQKKRTDDSVVETEIESSTRDSAKEDPQPVAKPPGPNANIKIPFPDCKDCRMSYEIPLPDCKDCTLLTREDLGYGDEELFHRHHHHNNHHKRTSAGGGNRSESVVSGATGSAALPPNMQWGPRLRRNSNTSNVSGRSSAWMKTAGRPSVVSYAVTPPMDEPEQQQTINPWVSILLTLVLSIHNMLEGLTIGSSTNIQTIKTTIVVVVTHKGFDSFSLGNSLVASGYWESNRIMFFVLAGTVVAVDIVSIGIGMGLSSVFSQEGSFASGILQALLGGSFLFVSTVELIPGELEKMRKYNLPLLPMMLSLCAGFALMTLLAKWGV